MGKLSGYLRLMRPINCLMMGFAVVVGAALASPNTLSALWRNLVYGFITGFMLTASSMVINDYYDRETDVINEPNRPIPSGAVKPKEALVFSLICTIIGFAASYLTNMVYRLCLVTAIVAWIVSVAYTTVGKRSGLPGNLLVSACVAVPFIYGSIAVAGAVKLNVFIFASMAFLSITGREVTKGIVDVQGDRRRRVKTVAVRYGERTATAVAALFYISAVSLSPIPLFLPNPVSFWYIPFVIVADFGLVASSFMLLEDYSRESARKIKNILLLWGFFGLLAFIAGALW